jgi:hypothetical protein
MVEVMRMPPKFAAFALLLFAAEIVGSWWVWRGAPTDTLRVAYAGFWLFEVERLCCWFVAGGIASVASLAALKPAYHKRDGVLVVTAVSVAIAVGTELLTSLCYCSSLGPTLSDHFTGAFGTGITCPSQAIFAGRRF